MLAIFFLLAATAFAQPDRFGLPDCTGSDRELAVRTGFVVCHSSSLRVPLWAAHEVGRQPGTVAALRSRHFRRDQDLRHPGAADSDYRNSGWSRGHLVPAQDLVGDEQAVRDSFLLSNAVPQNPSLNSGKWRVLENAIRRIASEADFVIVLTGSIFCGESPERIGANQIAVPCELFKVVLYRHGPETKVLAAVLPNDRNPCEELANFIVPVAEVERRAGLHFFPKLQTEGNENLKGNPGQMRQDDLRTE